MHIPCCAGLLRGDPVSNGDRHSGSPYPPNPSVVPEGHLPSRICPQRPGPDEGQVSESLARIQTNANTYRQTKIHARCCFHIALKQMQVSSLIPAFFVEVYRHRIVYFWVNACVLSWWLVDVAWFSGSSESLPTWANFNEWNETKWEFSLSRWTCVSCSWEV